MHGARRAATPELAGIVLPAPEFRRLSGAESARRCTAKLKKWGVAEPQVDFLARAGAERHAGGLPPQRDVLLTTFCATTTATPTRCSTATWDRRLSPIRHTWDSISRSSLRANIRGCSKRDGRSRPRSRFPRSLRIERGLATLPRAGSGSFPARFTPARVGSAACPHATTPSRKCKPGQPANFRAEDSSCSSWNEARKFVGSPLFTAFYATAAILSGRRLPLTLPLRRCIVIGLREMPVHPGTRRIADTAARTSALPFCPAVPYRDALLHPPCGTCILHRSVRPLYRHSGRFLVCRHSEVLVCSSTVFRPRPLRWVWPTRLGVSNSGYPLQFVVGIMGAEEESACIGRRSFSPLFYRWSLWPRHRTLPHPTFGRRISASSANPSPWRRATDGFRLASRPSRRNPPGQRPARHAGR